jgi:hypothetical protein
MDLQLFRLLGESYVTKGLGVFRGLTDGKVLQAGRLLQATVQKAVVPRVRAVNSGNAALPPPVRKASGFPDRYQKQTARGLASRWSWGDAER